jgi:mannose/fructose/N-acetylgalactosamine-specific phosphotransferase system component IID
MIVRVALTPLAAVGDTVMVGAVASVVAFILACESGFRYSP